MTLTPMKKYSKYGVFPYKIMLHIALLFFTMMEVVLIIQPDTSYQASIAKYFLYLFMVPTNSGNDVPRMGEKIMLHSVSDTAALVQQVVSNFSNASSSNNLEIFSPAANPFDDGQIGVTMFVVPVNPETYSFESTYTLTVDDLGPFSES